MQYSPQHYSKPFKMLKSTFTKTEILIFPGFLSFFRILKILNFHISITGKVAVIFPGFQGFPGAVGILFTVDEMSVDEVTWTEIPTDVRPWSPGSVDCIIYWWAQFD